MHKHAVTHIGGTTAGHQKYWYDANGNATRRITDATYDLIYDAENRLTQLKKNGAVSGTYVYDGDGVRVKETAGGVTRVFIGAYFEWTGSTTSMKRYYYAGGTRVAMRTGSSTLYYLLSDHLGSQALTLDSASARLNTNTELRYMPYGVARYTAGTTPTTFNFTGQRKDTGSGLLFYNARWYDPVVGRFLQADTFVQNNETPPTPAHALTVSYANPGILNRLNEQNRSLPRTDSRGAPAPTDPQFLNRYNYVRNNPLTRIDPGGNLAWFVAPLVGGALIGGTISTLGYLAAAHVSGQEVTAGGVAGAFASGAVAGVVSVFATPLAGSALKLAGMAATNTALTAGAAAVNAAGGATAYLAGGAVENTVNQATGAGATFKPSVGGAALNAVTAGALSVGLSKAFPVNNSTMRTMRQAAHFMPGREAETIVWSRLISGNAQNLYWRQTAVSVGVGGASGVGYQNLLAE